MNSCQMVLMEPLITSSVNFSKYFNAIYHSTKFLEHYFFYDGEAGQNQAYIHELCVFIRTRDVWLTKIKLYVG